MILQFMEEMRQLRAHVSAENEKTRTAVEAQRTQQSNDYRELRGMVEGVQSNMTTEFKEVRQTMGEMAERLAAGSERFDSMNARIVAVELAAKHDTTALMPKPMDRSSDRVKTAKRKTPPWWLVAAAGGALAFAGERAYKWVAFVASQEPPVVTQQQAPAAPSPKP